MNRKNSFMNDFTLNVCCYILWITFIIAVCVCVCVCVYVCVHVKTNVNIINCDKIAWLHTCMQLHVSLTNIERHIYTYHSQNMLEKNNSIHWKTVEILLLFRARKLIFCYPFCRRTNKFWTTGYFVSVRFFFNKCSTNVALNWFKVTVKTFIMLQNISNKSIKCFCTFDSSKNPEKNHVFTKSLGTTVFSTDKKCVDMPEIWCNVMQMLFSLQNSQAIRKS